MIAALPDRQSQPRAGRSARGAPSAGSSTFSATTADILDYRLCRYHAAVAVCSCAAVHQCSRASHTIVLATETTRPMTALDGGHLRTPPTRA